MGGCGSTPPPGTKLTQSGSSPPRSAKRVGTGFALVAGSFVTVVQVFFVLVLVWSLSVCAIELFGFSSIGAGRAARIGREHVTVAQTTASRALKTKFSPTKNPLVGAWTTKRLV